MPVGGRINRRDNLRSKKAVTKTQSSKDKTSKLSKTSEKELHDAEILESPSTTNSDSLKIVKSDNITKENVENSELDKASIEDKEISSSSSRRTKGFKRILLNPDTNFLEENLEEPKKKKLGITKNVDSEALFKKDKSDLVDKTKNEDKHINLSKRKVRGAAQKDDLSLVSVSVDQKTNSPKNLKEVINETPKKSDKISKKEKNVIINKVTEIFLDDIATKVKLRKRNATLEKSVEANNLAKVASKDEQELISMNDSGDYGRDTQEKNEISNTPMKVKDESAPTRLGRRNAIRRNFEKKLAMEMANDDAEVNTEIVDLDKDSRENASTDSSIPILTSMEHTVEAPLKSEVVSKRTRKQEVVSKIPEPIKSDDTAQKRLDTTKRPFVVEKEESIAVTGKSQENIKIPGLVMLDNIRKRKSMMINAKPVIAKDKNVQNPKEYVENLEEKEIEKPTHKTKRSVARRKTVKEKEDGDSVEENCSVLDQAEMSCTNQPSSTEIVQIDKVSTTESQKKTPGRPKKSIVVKENVPLSSDEKIPGLKMIADIKRRKSEMLAASNNLKELSSKTNVRKSVAPVVKDQLTDAIDKISKNDTEEKKVIRQGVSTTDSTIEKKPVAVGSQKDERKTGNIAHTPKHEEKVPGFATIQELKEMKTTGYTRPSIHLKKLERIPEKPNKSEKSSLKKQSMTSDKVPGLSTTDKLKKRNEIHNQDPLSSNENTSTTSNGHQIPMECSNTVAQVSIFNTPVPSTPLSAKVQSMKGYKPGASILSKPSPYKRPILDQDTDEIGSASKMPRCQIERRQSVTFKNDVEVKEIHFNSFNSTSDEGSINEPVDSAKILEQQLNSELERTKNRLACKRSRNVNVSFSGIPHASLGPSVFPNPDARAATRKHSDLSKLISARFKEQSNSPTTTGFCRPLGPSYSTSSSLKKFASLPTSSATHRDMSSHNFRNFKQDPASMETSGDDSLNSVDLNGEEKDKPGKMKCLIM